MTLSRTTFSTCLPLCIFEGNQHVPSKKFFRKVDIPQVGKEWGDEISSFLPMISIQVKSSVQNQPCQVVDVYLQGVFSRFLRYSDVRVGTRWWELGVISSIISRVCNPSHVLDNPISHGEPFSFAFRLCDRSRFAFTGKLKAKIVHKQKKKQPETHFRSSAFVSVNVAIL